MNDLYGYEEISVLTGISKGALRRRLAAGNMPPPDLRIGGSPAWRFATLEDWLRTAAPGDRVSARRAAVGDPAAQA